MNTVRLACLFGTGLALVAASLAAAAAPVTTTFTSVVTQNNPLAGTPAVGSLLAGSYTIDSAVTTVQGPNCVATVNCWSGVGTSFTWQGQTFTPPGQANFYGVFISITDSVAGTGSDTFEVKLNGLAGFLSTGTLTFTDATGSAFETAANPLFPNFASFTSAKFSYVPFCVTGIGCAFNPFYYGDLTSLDVAPAVPEPATVALLMFGLAAIVARQSTRSAARDAASSAP